MLSSGVSFLVFIYIARMVPLNIFGEYSLLMAYSAIGTMAFYSIIRRSIVRLGGVDETLLKVMYTLSLYITVLLIVFSMFVLFYVDDIKFVYVLSLIFSLGLFDTLQEINLAKGKQFIFNVNIFLRALLTLVLIILSDYILEVGLLEIILSLSISYMFFAIVNAVYYRWLVTVDVSFSAIGKIIGFGFPLMLSTGMVYVIDFFDRFYIARILNDQAVGIYSGIYSLAQQITGVVMVAIYSYYWPKIVSYYGNGNCIKSLNLRYGAVLLILSFTICLISGLFHQDIIYRILGVGFSSDSGLFFLITSAILISCLKSYLVDVHFMLLKKTRYIFIISLFSALINVILNVAFIPKFGIYGAAYSTIITFVFSISLSIITVRRLYMLGLD